MKSLFATGFTILLFYLLQLHHISGHPRPPPKSAINTHKRRIPSYCHRSYETIQCFERCEEDPEIERLMAEAHLDTTVYGDEFYVRKVWLEQNDMYYPFTVTRPGIAYPCRNKCETDPRYWTCMNECTDVDHTALWETSCFVGNNTNHDGSLIKNHSVCTQTEDGGYRLSDLLCVGCLLEATRERLEQSCFFANLPKNASQPKETESLCESLKVCKDNVTEGSGGGPFGAMVGVVKQCANDNPSDVSLLRKCVNDPIAATQRRCCYSSAMRNATRCRQDNRKCDKICEKILPPRICRTKCEQYRIPKIKKCIEDCQDIYPVSEDLCEHCLFSSQSRKPFDTARSCVANCSTTACIKTTCVKKGQLPYLYLNCINADHIRQLAKFGKENSLPVSVDWTHFIPSKITWMSTHFTPLECPSINSNWELCKEMVTKERTHQEMEGKCNDNPFRTLDMLACALELNLTDLSLQPILDTLENKKCEVNEALRLELYKLMFLYENHVCDNFCGETNNHTHPTRIENMRCRTDKCQQPNDSPLCKPPEDQSIVQLLDFATCKWKVDVSKAEAPYTLWAQYFNEYTPNQVGDKLISPLTTRILQKTNVHGKKAFYSFPYFLVVRGVCEGGYYDDGAYRFFMVGGNPVVEMKYEPPTSRHYPKASVQGIFQSALVRLDLGGKDSLIPENPRSINKSNSLGCHAKICHPGFAVPLMLLQIPNFQVVVNAQEVYSQHVQTIYVSLFHSRSKDGTGKIQIASPVHPPHAAQLFPKERSTFAVDSEIFFHVDCYADDIYDPTANEFINRRCPELEHILDREDLPYKDSTNPFAPLDAEDIFRSQYTHGTSPVQAIAGFYDPKYLIIGDADMNHFEVVNWGALLNDLEKDQGLLSCVQFEFKNRGHVKPIYSQMDRTDAKYPIRYYRQRYAPRPYYTPPEMLERGNVEDLAETAIFEAIGLEDRLLLVTTKGLVSYYGQTNATVAQDKFWTYNKTEIVNKCFRIVRILPKAQPYSDTIVGVTYDYIVRTNSKEDPGGIKEISQEIWVGKFTAPGESIDWIQVTSEPKASVELVQIDLNEYNAKSAAKPDTGKLMAFLSYKNPGLPYELREGSPKSEVEALCYKAFRTKIAYLTKNVVVALIDEPGWCYAIDATPLQMQELTVQLLVRLRVNHIPKGNGTSTPIYFYIVASNMVQKGVSDVVWQINTVIPRVPCVHAHREAVTNVLSFDETYFKEESVGSMKYYGCYDGPLDKLEKLRPYNLYLNGMSYTRTSTNHLFLYGTRLLQSTNRGGSFVYLRGFPHSYNSINVGDPFGNVRNVHRIVKMAFDDGGHYVFFTNKRELWFGSAGSSTPIRLRPSRMWSTVQLGISKVKNFNDGIPFSVNFDSQNQLYEMIAVRGDDGQVSQIMKRPVGEDRLLRLKTLLEKLDGYSTKLAERRKKKGELSQDLQKPFNYDIEEWTNVCRYLSPNLRQNFSQSYSRLQGMIFPHPEQHLYLGIPHTEGSLMAFQAATFALVWRTFYDPPVSTYAGMHSDPFQEWAHAKKTEAILSLLRFTQGDPREEDTILIEPSRYKRIFVQPKTLHSNLLQFYSLDYNTIAELRLEFSLRNDYQILHSEFEADEINGMALNVENANGSVVQINTEKEIHADRAAVVFIIRMSLKRKAGLKQDLPGTNIFPVAITYHLIGAFGNCLQNRASSIVGDKIETVAMVGCPTSRSFVFDWNKTLSSLKFRGDRSNSHVEHGTGSQCHKSGSICFFSRSPLVLHFKVFDEARQVFIPYDGKYVMRILGGGTRRDKMRMYTQEEQEAHNIPGVSDVSLIWNEWDAVNHQKVEQQHQTIYDPTGKEVKRDSREVILQSGKSTIIWACHTLSPCARVSPTSGFEVVFWFRILVTNRDVDSNTLCLYEKEFDILLYGFPPSPEIQLFTTLGFSCLMLTILYIAFICCRRRQRVWLHTKGTVKNWYHIVKDAIPKKLRFYEPPLADDGPAMGKPFKKLRRFGSHEGSREGSYSSAEGGSWENMSPHRKESSSTLGSDSTSNVDSSQILPEGAHYVPPSAKDIVYDQLLTSRLKSIVEKNRTMRTNLLKKASVQVGASELEIEEDFEKQFGRTVSQESVFTPPMPKDKKGGFESFF